MISVRPPLSSVMSRSAVTLTRSLSPERDHPPCGGRPLPPEPPLPGTVTGGAGGGDHPPRPRPGIGNGVGVGGRGGDAVGGAVGVPGLYVGAPEPSMPIAYTSTSLSRICCFRSSMRVWLVVSLPSEITSSDFF